MSSLFTIYRFCRAHYYDAAHLWPAAREEMQAALGLLPWIVADRGIPWHDQVLATDASEEAYGVCPGSWHRDDVRAVGRVSERSRFRRAAGRSARDDYFLRAGFVKDSAGDWAEGPDFDTGAATLEEEDRCPATAAGPTHASSRHLGGAAEPGASFAGAQPGRGRGARTKELYMIDLDEGSSILSDAGAEDVDGCDHAAWLIDSAFPEVPPRLTAAQHRRVIASRPFKYSEDIFILEGSAILSGLRMMISHTPLFGRRLAILCDNMSVVLCFERVRNIYVVLLSIVRRFAALLIALNLRVTVRWIPSEAIVADAPPVDS